MGRNVDVDVGDEGGVSVHELEDASDCVVDGGTKTKGLILHHSLLAQAEETDDTSTDSRLLDSRSCSSVWDQVHPYLLVRRRYPSHNLSYLADEDP